MSYLHEHAEQHFQSSDTVRDVVIGMADGLWRDQIFATRGGMASSYSLDDIQQVIELLVNAFHEPAAQRAKAS